MVELPTDLMLIGRPPCGDLSMRLSRRMRHAMWQIPTKLLRSTPSDTQHDLWQQNLSWQLHRFGRPFCLCAAVTTVVWPALRNANKFVNMPQLAVSVCGPPIVIIIRRPCTSDNSTLTGVCGTLQRASCNMCSSLEVVPRVKPKIVAGVSRSCRQVVRSQRTFMND